jgi:hypothetical protein
VLDQRGRLLVAALGFAGLPRPSYDRALWALRFWLDSWAGIGRVAIGRARQSYDPQLTRYDERGWRASFYTTGMEHSITSAPAAEGEPNGPVSAGGARTALLLLFFEGGAFARGLPAILLEHGSLLSAARGAVLDDVRRS